MVSSCPHLPVASDYPCPEVTGPEAGSAEGDGLSTPQQLQHKNQDSHQAIFRMQIKTAESLELKTSMN